jgi:cytochrome b561
MPDSLLPVDRRNSLERRPARYHPALVAIHWITAVAIGLAIATGKVSLERAPGSSADRYLVLGTHMILGMTILGLTVTRLVVRTLTRAPPRATTGSITLDALAGMTHYALYTAILLMALSGLATAILAGYPAVVFGDVSGPLPDASGLLSRRVHGVLGWVLLFLIALHICGAFYHHLVRNDGVLRRMWFREPSG